MVEIETEPPHVPTERNEESVVMVEAGDLNGSVTYYLEEGQRVEIRDDGPNYVEVRALD